VGFKNISRWTKSGKSVILSVMQHLRSHLELVSFPSSTRTDVSHMVCSRRNSQSDVAMLGIPYTLDAYAEGLVLWSAAVADMAPH
jgi:hypothetical protein